MTLPDFLIIPSILILDESLQPLDREVYGVVYWSVRLKNEKCTMSNKTISSLLHASESGVANSLGRLTKGRYVYIKNNAEKQRIELIPLIRFTQMSKGVTEMSIEAYSNEEQNKSIYIKNKNDKKEKTSSSINGSSPVIIETQVAENSKNAIVPLTPLEKWEMAIDLDVPLWVIEQTDKNYWDYIEDPKKREKYKTSYKVIHKWIEYGLQRGEFKNCSETEKLQLDMQHPDKLKEADDVFAWAREEKITE